jgi:Aminotransferase class I and II
VTQNPTGTDISPHVALRVLQAVERHNFTVVEDDIFCDLLTKTTPRLATIDQLNRVIYVRSFSKSLSGSLQLDHGTKHRGRRSVDGFATDALSSRRRRLTAQKRHRPHVLQAEDLAARRNPMRPPSGLALAAVIVASI